MAHNGAAHTGPDPTRGIQHSDSGLGCCDCGKKFSRTSLLKVWLADQLTQGLAANAPPLACCTFTRCPVELKRTC